MHDLVLGTIVAVSLLTGVAEADCTMPPPDIAQRFLDICDKHEGMLAVHCLAGLGRTGTLICMWIMKVAHCRV